MLKKIIFLITAINLSVLPTAFAQGIKIKGYLL